MSNNNKYSINKIITTLPLMRIEKKERTRMKISEIGFDEFTRLLIQEGAQEILLPMHANNREKDNIEWNIKRAGAFGKRIRIIDENAFYAKKVKAFLNPIMDDIISQNKLKNIQNDINNIGVFTYFLLLGMKEKAEISIDPNNIRKSLKILSENIIDTEAKYRVACLQGILNNYSTSNIMCLNLKVSTINNPIIMKIENLFEDARMDEISQKKYELGSVSIKQNITLKWLKTKKYFNRIIADTKYSNLLRIGDIVINYVSEKYNIPVSELKTILRYQNQFHPICINADLYLAKEISRAYNKPTIIMDKFGYWLKDISINCEGTITSSPVPFGMNDLEMIKRGSSPPILEKNRFSS